MPVKYFVAYRRSAFHKIKVGRYQSALGRALFTIGYTGQIIKEWVS